MSFHLSGSGLEVRFAPISQCTSSHSGSSGSCVVEMDAWRQAWLLCYALVQLSVAVAVLFANGVKTVVSQVREMVRRFDLAAESAVLCVRGAGSVDWLRVFDVVAGVLGAMVLLSFLVREISVHRSAMCEDIHQNLNSQVNF